MFTNINNLYDCRNLSNAVLDQLLFQRLVDKFSFELDAAQARGVATDIWSSLSSNTRCNYVRAFKKWVLYCEKAKIKVENPSTA